MRGPFEFLSLLASYGIKRPRNTYLDIKGKLAQVTECYEVPGVILKGNLG